MAVESPDEGESWKEQLFRQRSGVAGTMLFNKSGKRIPLQDASGKPASWVSRSSAHESRSFGFGVWKYAVAF